MTQRETGRGWAGKDCLSTDAADMIGPLESVMNYGPAAEAARVDFVLILQAGERISGTATAQGSVTHLEFALSGYQQHDNAIEIATPEP